MDAEFLIGELKAQPESFFEEGRGYDLLKEYFGGADITSLIELLACENLSVRKTAVWIVSELGKEAAPIVEAVFPLLDDDERYVRYYATEIVMVCSGAGVKGLFHQVVSALEDNDHAIRKLGMFLISNAALSQLEEAVRYFSGTGDLVHVRGLRSLLVASDEVGLADEPRSDLYGTNSIAAMYKAISLRRHFENTGRKAVFQLDQIQDEATKEFLAERLM
ncbi:hypothetical protein [Pyruvatibacter sp.]|uniref:HEAT repeat domain-containing protein n=1 Tax=Pyruvatibacter sp. TaxID=1981328 RepID=UPI00326304B7